MKILIFLLSISVSVISFSKTQEFCYRRAKVNNIRLSMGVELEGKFARDMSRMSSRIVCSGSAYGEFLYDNYLNRSFKFKNKRTCEFINLMFYQNNGSIILSIDTDNKVVMTAHYSDIPCEHKL